MDKSKIPELLINRALAMTIDPAIQIIGPYEPEDPPQAEHIELQFVPNESANLFVGNEDASWHQGFLQATVVWPKAEGVIAPIAIASQVIEAWKKGTVLFGDGFKLKVYRTPWDGQPFKDGQWVRIPVSIPYQVIA